MGEDFYIIKYPSGKEDSLISSGAQNEKHYVKKLIEERQTGDGEYKVERHLANVPPEPGWTSEYLYTLVVKNGKVIDERVINI